MARRYTVLSGILSQVLRVKRTAEEGVVFLQCHGILPKISGGYYEQ